MTIRAGQGCKACRVVRAARARSHSSAPAGCVLPLQLPASAVGCSAARGGGQGAEGTDSGIPGDERLQAGAAGVRLEVGLHLLPRGVARVRRAQLIRPGKARDLVCVSRGQGWHHQQGAEISQGVWLQAHVAEQCKTMLSCSNPAARLLTVPLLHLRVGAGRGRGMTTLERITERAVPAKRHARRGLAYPPAAGSRCSCSATRPRRRQTFRRSTRSCLSGARGRGSAARSKRGAGTGLAGAVKAASAGAARGRGHAGAGL